MNGCFGRVPLLAVAAALAVSAGCGPATPDLPPAAEAKADAERRIEGRWRLVRFEAEQPLSAPFQAMLDYQIQVMVIHIGQGRIRAEAPGIHFDRKYEVKSAEGDRFRAVSYDEGGVAYDAQCQWTPDGQGLDVLLETHPWRGVGHLQRLP